MRKRILILAVLSVLLVCMLAVSAAAAEEVPSIVRYCEYCDLVETWYPLDNTTAIETKHYYLAKTVVFGEKKLTEGTTMCLELNGYTYTANRHMILEKGAVLNVQDNAGGGKMQGRGSDNLDPGRTVWIKSGAVMNLYNGTLTAATSDVRSANRGGVLGIYGTFNMYGGKVCDGIAEELGGTIFLDTKGLFNMYGGSVSGGSAPNSPCCYLRGKVLFVNDASIEHATVTPNSDSGIYQKDQLTVRGKYTGTTCVTFYKVTEPGMDVGNSDGADLSEGNLYMSSGDLLVKVAGEELVTYLPDAAVVTSGGSTISYETLEAALASLRDGDLLTLYRGTDAPVTVDKSVTLDLNGRKIANTLTAASGVAVLVKDSFTDDYSVADGVYGSIQAVAGDVRGAEATQDSDPYLMITDSKGISFHAVGLNISSMALKGEEAALYFNNTFAGDAMVKAQVDSFGVVMSAEGAPTIENMNNEKHYTRFSGELFGTDQGNTGSLLTGIMKEENDLSVNRRNAEIPVYGRAYVQLKTGQYLLGVCRSRDLRSHVQEAGNQFDTISPEAQDSLMKLLGRYAEVTEAWDVEEIYHYMENHEKETLKIMIVGNSGAVDAYQLLYQAFKDQYPDQKLVLGVMYYSGCTVAQHIGFYEKESPVYSYRINRDGTWVFHDGSTLQDGLLDQQWDIVSIHSNKKTTVKKSDADKLAGYIAQCVQEPYALYYDYTWPNPNDETFFSEGYDPQPPAGYKDTLIRDFGFDPNKQLQVITDNIRNDILVDGQFDEFVNCAPAIMYAINRLGCSQLELYRDYTHLSDYGRLIAAYCWVTQITGQPLEEVNIDLVEKSMRHRRAQAFGDMVVTEEMKQVIIASVNHALENRFDVPLPLE